MQSQSIVLAGKSYRLRGRTIGEGNMYENCKTIKMPSNGQKNKKKDVDKKRPDDWKRARRDQRRRRRQEKEYGYDVSYSS